MGSACDAAAAPAISSACALLTFLASHARD